MRNRYGDDDGGSRLTGLAALGLLMLGLASGFAFFASDQGAFEGGPTARLHNLSQVEPTLTVPDAPPENVDQVETGSVEASAPAADAPLCNIDACARAYRSFRASDCTYQPYDGPRRLCRKE